jgi:hypothetical protein
MDGDDLLSHLEPLMASSLSLWNAPENLELRRDRGSLVLWSADRVVLIIRPASTTLAGLFRWSVEKADGSHRHCGSVLGLLQIVRGTLGLEPQALPLRLGVTGAPS